MLERLKPELARNTSAIASAMLTLTLNAGFVSGGERPPASWDTVTQATEKFVSKDVSYVYLPQGARLLEERTGLPTPRCHIIDKGVFVSSLGEPVDDFNLYPGPHAIPIVFVMTRRRTETDDSADDNSSADVTEDVGEPLPSATFHDHQIKITPPVQASAETDATIKHAPKRAYGGRTRSWPRRLTYDGIMARRHARIMNRFNHIRKLHDELIALSASTRRDGASIADISALRQTTQKRLTHEFRMIAIARYAKIGSAIAATVLAVAGAALAYKQASFDVNSCFVDANKNSGGLNPNPELHWDCEFNMPETHSPPPTLPPIRMNPCDGLPTYLRRIIVNPDGSVVTILVDDAKIPPSEARRILGQ